MCDNKLIGRYFDCVESAARGTWIPRKWGEGAGLGMTKRSSAGERVRNDEFDCVGMPSSVKSSRKSLDLPPSLRVGEGLKVRLC